MTDIAAAPVVEPVSGPAARFREGAGRLCLDFVRTLRYRGTPAQKEELVDPEALAEWVRQFGTDDGRPVPSPDDAQVREARALREAVYALLTAALEGDVVGPAARTRLNRAAAAPVPVPRLTASGAVTRTSDAPVAAALSLVARDVLDLATSPA
ncbi:ABATE domain-containing protein, partial [Actinacidiphila rubida]